MNTQNFKKNGNQKFPLTTEALDFIQEQIKLVYGLTSLAGQFIIICEPTSGKDGLVIVDGELLPLKGTKSDFSRIVVSQVDERVALGDGSFEGIVRSTRVATYSIPMRGTIGGEVGDIGDIVIRPRAAAAAKEYALSKFTVLKNMQTLMRELDEAKSHHLPKGSVVDWYGEPTCDNIPYGFIPCGLFYSGHTDEAVSVEMSRWINRYGGNNISIARTGEDDMWLQIKNCMGMAIPQLHDRFIVAAGNAYGLGDIGGADAVKLTSNQSGLPAHEHSYTHTTCEIGSVKHDGWNQTTNLVYKTYQTTGGDAQDAALAHENRPPYFALYKLIKVI